MSPAALLALRERTTCSVEEAADALGISRGTAYRTARETDHLDLARRVPVIKVTQRRWSVPTLPLLRALGVEPNPTPNSTEDAPRHASSVEPSRRSTKDGKPDSTRRNRLA